MDGEFASSAVIKPNWIKANRAALSTSVVVPSYTGRGSRFLQRDLNDEALQKPAEPVFNEADLAAKRQEGFDAGYAAGLAAAAASRDAYQAAAEVSAIEIIAAAMTDGSRQSRNIADQAADALAKTLIASMNAVMPSLIQRSALHEVGAMLAQVLPGLSREPAVRVEVPQDMASYVVTTLDALAPEHCEKISVTGEDNMEPGEARVYWGAGQARRSPAQVWQAVMAALLPALDSPEVKDMNNGK